MVRTSSATSPYPRTCVCVHRLFSSLSSILKRAEATFYGKRCLTQATLRSLRCGATRRDALGAGLILTSISNTQPARALFGGKTIPAPADVAAPPADAEKTASGLASKVLTPGNGAWGLPLVGG